MAWQIVMVCMLRVKMMERLWKVIIQFLSTVKGRRDFALISNTKVQDSSNLEGHTEVERHRSEDIK